MTEITATIPAWNKTKSANLHSMSLESISKYITSFPPPDDNSSGIFYLVPFFILYTIESFRNEALVCWRCEALVHRMGYFSKQSRPEHLIYLLSVRQHWSKYLNSSILFLHTMFSKMPRIPPDITKYYIIMSITSK